MFKVLIYDLTLRFKDELCFRSLKFKDNIYCYGLRFKFIVPVKCQSLILMIQVKFCYYD
jgi:hypothetical protein